MFRWMVLVLCWPLLALADNNWQQVVDDLEDDIQVYVRTIPGSDLKAFKGTTRVKSRLTAAVALLEDYSVAPQWMYNCKAIDVIERQSSTQLLSYMVSDAPWPVSERDVVVESQLLQSGDGTVTIKLQSRDDVFPVSEGLVRMSALSGYWRFTPQPDGWLAVEYQLHAEPGGSLPSW